MTQLLRRLHYLLNRRRLEEELAGEMEFHREMTNRESGTRFGNTLRLREEARDAWGWTWIDRLVQDLSYAARVLRKSPGFTLSAVLMLAIGIGANVALFGFFDLMVLRPLNVREPDTLLRFHRHSPEQYAYALPYPEVAFFREHSKTLSAVLAVSPSKVSIEQEGKQVAAHFVSANYFQELGAAAGLGRVFDPARDEAASADAVVVLSHGFWQRQFGADPALIGRTIRLNDKPATVIGIAPLGFGGLSLEEPAVWVPITQEPRLVNGSRLLTDFAVENSSVQLFGRLQRGLTPQAAEEELRSLAAELRKQYSDAVWENESLPSELGGYARGLRFGGKRGTGSEGRDELYPMLAIAGALVLLILTVACANLGSLLLARGVARQQEISIRIAIGAGTGRLIRQLLTESLLLALLGSAAGLFVGYLVLRSLMQLSGAPTWLDPTPDWRVLLFALGAGLVTVTLFGLMPAIQVARQRYRAGLTRQILVGVQVAASCVLLIVAGLLGRALNHAVSAHPGFEYERVISIDPGLSGHGYSVERARAYLDALQTRLRAIPGIESVSLALTPPLGRRTISARVEINGQPVNVQINRVNPEFAETMKIPLLRGRNLQLGNTREAVISESLARTVWPAEDALGKTFSLGEGYTIIGIAGTARLNKLEDSDSVEVYMPIESADPPSLFVLARSAARPEDMIRSIALAAKGLDPSLFPEVELVKGGLQRKLKSAENSALAVSLLSLVAHLLACLGILGLVAYAVSQRTQEFGIRMALGAKPSHVLSALVRQFTWPVAAGMLAGIGAAIAISRALRSVLYGVSHLDLPTYLITIAFFLCTIMLAAVVPARRALRIDPLRALRHE